MKASHGIGASGRVSGAKLDRIDGTLPREWIELGGDYSAPPTALALPHAYGAALDVHKVAPAMLTF